MGLGKPGIEGRDAAACPETQGFGLAETSTPLRAGTFTLQACKIPGIREMARRAKAAAAAGFEDSEGFCKSLNYTKNVASLSRIFNRQHFQRMAISFGYSSARD